MSIQVVHRSKYKGPFSMDIGIPCTECESHTVCLAYENSKGEARG